MSMARPDACRKFIHITAAFFKPPDEAELVGLLHQLAGEMR